MFDGTTRILVIDDDKEEFLLLQGIFDALPADIRAYYQLEFADSTATATRKLVESHFDLFIVDYKLGAANGIDFILEMRASGVAVPALLVTGQDELDLPDEAGAQMELGMLRFLHKAELNWRTLSTCLRDQVPQLLNVLLVDDDDDCLVKLRENLNDVGLIQFLTEQVRTLEEARASLAGNDVEIVILDYLLSGERGSELMAELNAMQKPPFVLICSGSALAEKDEAFTEAVARGHAAFFPKELFTKRDLSRYLLGASRMARLVERRYRLHKGTPDEPPMAGS